MYKMSLKNHIALSFIHSLKVLEWLLLPGTMPGSGDMAMGKLERVSALRELATCAGVEEGGDEHQTNNHK